MMDTEHRPYLQQSYLFLQVVLRADHGGCLQPKSRQERRRNSLSLQRHKQLDLSSSLGSQSYLDILMLSSGMVRSRYTEYIGQCVRVLFSVGHNLFFRAPNTTTLVLLKRLRVSLTEYKRSPNIILFFSVWSPFCDPKSRYPLSGSMPGD